MDEFTIEKYITDTFPETQVGENFGYKFFFYGTDHKLPFATLASSDNEYDRVSNLDRPGVFRLNLGVSRQTFESLFGTTKVDTANYDFTALDTIMPHPHYAAQHFICVLSPSDKTWPKLRLFLSEAYDIAARRNVKQK